MSRLDAILEELVLRPRGRGPLPGASARGQACDGDNVMTMQLLVENEVLVAAGFDTTGDPVLLGCASFLLLGVRGLSVHCAACVRPWILCESLRLPRYDRRAELTVAAFRAALADHHAHHPKPGKVETGTPGAPRGHRKPKTLPRPTRQELDLLRPGETCEAFVEERIEILGVLQNLDACLNIGAAAHSFRRDDTSRLREDLLALTASVCKALPLLSESDQQLVMLVGFKGLTETEVAEELHVSQPRIHERLRTVAWRIQKIFRQAPIKTPPRTQS